MSEAHSKIGTGLAELPATTKGGSVGSFKKRPHVLGL
jgi:hypothetical protein